MIVGRSKFGEPFVSDASNHHSAPIFMMAICIYNERIEQQIPGEDPSRVLNAGRHLIFRFDGPESIQNANDASNGVLPYLKEVVARVALIEFVKQLVPVDQRKAATFRKIAHYDALIPLIARELDVRMRYP